MKVTRNDSIERFRERRHSRLLERVSRYDASQRLAYGLARKYGIDTKGMSPGEVWAALKEKTGKEVRDFYGASGSAGADKIRFGTASPKSFAKALKAAKDSRKGGDAWRVTAMDKAKLKEWHPKAKLHVTDGGSTIALDNGDIISACKKKGDSMTGRDLIAFAVKNGGKKLDSYAGNHDFYVSCGFEPVSWCKWDRAYEDGAKEQGWDPKLNKREAIVFYKYVGPGKVKNTDLMKFKKRNKASADYDKAMEKRDAEV